MANKLEQLSIPEQRQHGFGSSDAWLFWQLGNGVAPHQVKSPFGMILYERYKIFKGEHKPVDISSMPSVQVGNKLEPIMSKEIMKEYYCFLDSQKLPKFNIWKEYKRFSLWSNLDDIFFEEIKPGLKVFYVFEYKTSTKSFKEVLKQYFPQLIWQACTMNADAINLVHYQILPDEHREIMSADNYLLDSKRLQILEIPISAVNKIRLMRGIVRFKGLLERNEIKPNELVLSSSNSVLAKDMGKLADIKIAQIESQTKLDAIKPKIKNYMQNKQFTKLSNDELTISLVKSSVSESIDFKTLKEQDFELYQELKAKYPKQTFRDESIKITLKKEK